jgi:hypothetical protein
VRSKHYDDIAIHMLENHGIDLLDSEISDIIHVCAPALQAMQGDADTKTYTNLCQKGSAPQPAVPDENYKALYMELLYQVSTKHPDETRHETAMRYIRQAEDRTCGVSAAKGETE